MHEITKFICDYCERGYVNQRSAAKHEAECYYSDANRACATCAHMVACLAEVHTLAGGDDHIDDVWEIQCDIDLDFERDGEYGSRALKAHCDGWEKRVVAGTRRFGKTKIEVV